MKWLHQSHTTPDSLSTLLRYYNELARRFLLQRRFPQVITLYNKFQQYLNPQLQEQLSKMRSQMNKYYRKHRDEEIAEMIAFVREFDRIYTLASLLTTQITTLNRR